MSGYKFTRAWFDFCFDNPEKIKPVHHAIYHFTLDRCNRLGWKKKFGFSTDHAMETLGIKNYRTYSKAFNDLISFGFIKMIQKSKNQHTSNVIALVENPKANTKALDRALQMQGESSASIVKPLNNQKLNNKPLSEIEISEVPDDLNNYFQMAIKFQKVVVQNLHEKQAPAKVQEQAKFGNYVPSIRLMMEKDGVTSSQFDRALKLLRSPDGEFWKKHILSTQKLRDKISQLLSIEQKKQTVNNSTMNQSVTEKLQRYD